MGGQALLWFGLAGGSLVLAVTMLVNRYVRRVPQAVRGGGTVLVAGFLLLFALGALAAGVASVAAGR